MGIPWPDFRIIGRRMPRFDTRHFLFLQGPHGPFFAQLATQMRRAGAVVWRVGFNAGDRFLWPDAESYVPCHDDAATWPARVADLMAAKGITDLVLYGDTRACHAVAITAARAAGVTVHVFEEGYLRPYWVTYERGGSNGHSRLMSLSLAMMRTALSDQSPPMPEAPARWGDLRQHVFWGAVYHGALLAGRRWYPAFRPHRSLPAGQEFGLYLRRLCLMPLHRWDRMIAQARIRLGGYPFHLVLLQLEHDANFRAHSPFATMADFAAMVIDGFARGAPGHHHLVFKAHPLEDGRTPLASHIRRLAHDAGIGGRVHIVRGGKLARLLDQARSAVTVNSTAGQQALWRGLPLRCFGQAVYAKPGLVSVQTAGDFFANPDRPDIAAYRDLRRFLLDTSQVRGGFYSARGRSTLLRRITDMMLAPADPYDAVLKTGAAARQQLRLVQ